MSLTHEEFLVAWERAYSGIDRYLYLDVGFFVAWFAQAELSLTAVLAASIGVADHVAFDLLCKGMDARVKLERLRKSAKRHGGIGEHMSARLDYFQNRVVPVRNKVVHSSININEDDGPRRYWLSGLSDMPVKQLGLLRQPGPDPYEVTSRELYSFGVWVSFFAKDLSSLQPIARARKALEIDKPQSLLPQADHAAQHRKARSAKLGRKPRQSPSNLQVG